MDNAGRKRDCATQKISRDRRFLGLWKGIEAYQAGEGCCGQCYVGSQLSFFSSGLFLLDYFV